MPNPRALLFVLVLTAWTTCHAARAPFTSEDRWNWHVASDPQIRPDGQWVVYAESWNDRDANVHFANLWVASTEGKTRRRFTEGNWRDWSPRWSPDGTKIAWLSERDGKSRIHVRTLEAGTDGEVSTGEGIPLNLVWSPDGEWIAFRALAPVRADSPAWIPPSLLGRLRRDRQGYFQIFVVPVKDGGVRQVSTGNFDYLGEPAWMPDGQSLLAAREDGQIWAFRLAGGAPRQVTKEMGRNTAPLASPDGTKIAWMSASDNPQFYAVRKLCVMNADGSRVKLLTGGLDRDPTDAQWSSDSRTLYFLADDHGTTHVNAVRNDGTVRQVTNQAERLRGFSLADNGRAVSVRWDATTAGDVVTYTVDHVSQPVTLAMPNDRLLAEREIGPAEEIHYDSAGQTVQGWVVKPPGFDPAKKYPMILDIHETPGEMYGVDFNLRSQILAARGILVLCINPRGTPGYGEMFGNILHNAFPGDDYEDLMRGVDQVVSKGWVDPKRISVVGGLLAAWAIGHTDRFHAAVARRPIADWVTDVATAPDGSMRAREWRGVMPWEEPDQYWKHSPVYFARNFKTPTLILAGNNDAEGDELYFALRQLKVECALIRLESPEKPKEWIAELDATLGWLTR